MTKENIAHLNTLKSELSALVEELPKKEDNTFKIEFNDEKWLAKFQDVETKKTELEATRKLYDITDLTQEKFTAKTVDPKAEEKASFKADLTEWCGAERGNKLSAKFEMQITGPYDFDDGPHGVNIRPTYLDRYVATAQGIIKAWDAGAPPVEVDWLSSTYRQEIAGSEINAAAIVAEKGTVGVSSFATEEVAIALQNVSHLIKLTMQQKKGVKEAERLIMGRGRQMLKTKIDNLYLNNNTAGMRGLNFITNATSTAIGTDTYIDAILNAILRSMVYEIMPTDIILNQVIWGAISELKDDIGRYLLCDPANGGAKSVWGLPFVVDSKQPTTKIVVTDLIDNITKFIWNDGVVVRETDSDASDFEKHIFTVGLNSMITCQAFRPEAHQIITL